MLLGQTQHAIDGKGRLMMPARFRAAFAEGLVLTAIKDNCVLVYPVAAFEKLADKVRSLPQFQRESSMLQALMFSNAENVALDAQGRVLIPERLLSHASITGPALVIGAYDHLELWTPEAWQARSAEMASLAKQEDVWSRLGI
jgi:MraZ protein